MKATLIALLACVLLAVANAQTLSDSCTIVDSSCLDGMVVTSNYTRNVAPCRDRIVYTFTKLTNPGDPRCDISNFVTRGVRPESVSGGCTSDFGEKGYNKVFCPDYAAVFGNEGYKINVDGGCSGTSTVSLVVPSGDYIEDIMGVKGGTGCTYCHMKVFVPLGSNVVSVGACSNDTDCNDNNACTTDTCNSQSTCSTCSNVITNPQEICTPCLNDTDCTESAPVLDACTVWGCNQATQKCESSTIPDCFPCTTKEQCPVIGEAGATCLEYACVNNVCVESQVANVDTCCEQTSETTIDACYTCTKKTGCGFSGLNCVPNNASTGLPTTTTTPTISNCSTFRTGDGSTSGDGVDGGKVAAIVVPIVAAVVLAALAAGVFGIALAFLIAKKMQKGAMVSQLQAMGFTAEESSMICNSGAYAETGGENPFFITTDDTGARVISIPH